MKKPLSQILLNYSILSLAVSPELYSIIKCPPPFSGNGGGELSLLPNFQNGLGGGGGGAGGLTGSQLWGFTKKFDFREVHEKPIYRKGIV